jgi:hypothetical protein
MLRHLIIAASALCLVSAFCLFSLAQKRERSSKAAGFSKLSFEISTINKTEFVKLEPIPFTLRLTNKTSETVLGHSALKFSAGMVKLFVAHGDKPSVLRQLSPFPKEIFVKPIEMKPGDSYQARDLLTLNLDSIFAQPGEYEIYAVLLYPNSTEDIRSNTVKIRILEPQGVDREAYVFIHGHSRSSDFFSGRYLAGDVNAQSALERFVMSYKETVYGDYATFLLGELYLAQEDQGKANELFSRLADKRDFVFADKVANYRSKLIPK